MDHGLHQWHTEAWDRTQPDLAQLDPLAIARTMNQADQTVALAVEAQIEAIGRAIHLIADRLEQDGRLFYIGAGTSGRLGILDAAECPPTFNTPPELVTALMAGGRAAMFDAQEGAEDSQQQGAEDLARHGCLPGDVVVGITASGRTPYVLGALEWARRRTIATIGIACNPDAPIKTWADVPILIDTGPEVIMGSTRLKAGTAQKMVLNMLSTGAMAKLGKTYRNLMVDMRPTNQKLKQRAVRIVALALEIEEAQAFGLLEAAQQDAKLAIAMGLLGCDASTARTALGSAQGRLHRLGRLRGGREDGI